MPRPLREREEVSGMPAFPASGCSRMIGDTLVVKLSDDLSFLSPFEIDRTHKTGY